MQVAGRPGRQHKRTAAGVAVTSVLVAVLVGRGAEPPGSVAGSPSPTPAVAATAAGSETAPAPTALGPTLAPAGAPTPDPTPTPTAAATGPGDWQPSFPIRAAFYYPWFPEAWSQQGLDPFTDYVPSLGYYDSSNGTVMRSHIAAMQYGKVQVGIASWWGTGSRTDARIPALLKATANAAFRWTVYYEPEGQTDPSVPQIRDDLTYLADRYGSDPAYLRVAGRFVVVVYADGGDSCAMAERWARANTVHAFIVLKVFSGYRTCRYQPDGWHQYAPAVPDDAQAGYSYSISPGFHKATESGPRLVRDLARWSTSIRAMVSSGAPWQLITTFNEWGEGTSVESAAEWSTASGFGAYLDALHADGATVPQPTPAPTPVPTVQPTPAPDSIAVLVGAGDIASCSSDGDEQTASLLDELSGMVITLGDNAYEEGSLQQYRDCYAASWGRFKPRTRPAVGNHEYLTAGAQGFRDYFEWGTAATYYAYNAGTWRVYVMDSNCAKVGGCGPGSQQYEWLAADLTANPRTCVLAYWHHPRFTLGPHANDEGGAGILWDLLDTVGAEVILNGHDHNYQRWAPMRPDGTPDPNGIRLIINGAGGRNHTTPTRSDGRVEAQNHDTYGVVRLLLRPGSYDWQFIPVSGGSFSDSGSSPCH